MADGSSMAQCSWQCHGTAMKADGTVLSMMVHGSAMTFISVETPNGAHLCTDCGCWISFSLPKRKSRSGHLPLVAVSKNWAHFGFLRATRYRRGLVLGQDNVIYLTYPPTTSPLLQDDVRGREMKALLLSLWTLLSSYWNNYVATCVFLSATPCHCSRCPFIVAWLCTVHERFIMPLYQRDNGCCISSS